MSNMDRQVRRARRRVWVNIWLQLACRVAVVATLAAVVFYKTMQVIEHPVPLWLVAGVTGAGVFVVSVVWSRMRAPSLHQAAVMLDDAAGLRERVSSSLYLSKSSDPFARAVRQDAESSVASLTVSKHLRLRRPRSLPAACAAVVVALAVLLVPVSWLRSAQVTRQHERSVLVNQTKARVKSRLASFVKKARTNPALSDLKADLDKLAAMPAEKMTEPRGIRNEALKKIDKLADAVRRQRRAERFDKAKEFRKMMRRLKEPPGPDGDVRKLTRQLAAGDFKSAKETIRRMQEQLATLKQDSDKKFAETMKKQLDRLARQLEKVADAKALKKTLAQAGIKKQDVKRMLERLTKQDIEKVKKQLEKSGMTQQQIQKTVQQMRKQQGAQQMARKMSKAMRSAAQASGDMQMGEAMSSLEAAADQLSEMETMEQQKKELESALSDLDNLKDQMDQDCPDCHGTGQVNGRRCKRCGGSGMDSGRGMGQGKLGKGRGGLARSRATDVDFKIERQHVKTTKGRIIGQFLVDGKQVRGQAGEKIVEVVSAAERDATDAINRDRVPRQYQKALKLYFSRLPGGGIGGAPDDGTPSGFAPDKPVDDSTGATGAGDKP